MSKLDFKEVSKELNIMLNKRPKDGQVRNIVFWYDGEGEFKDKVTYVDDAKNTVRIIITEPQAGESTIETFLLPKVIVRFNEETNSFEMLKSKIATLGNLDLKEPTITYIGE